MHSIIKKSAAIAATTVALTAGALTVGAPDASAASTGTVTVKEGRKVVREADRQGCLTKKEARKIVKGTGNQGEGITYWYGKGKADYLIVEFNGGRCATGAYLVYDNGDAYAWIDGQVLWA